MKYIGAIITTYIVLFVLDIMQRRNHKRTQSLKKFTVRTITDVSIVCAVGGLISIIGDLGAYSCCSFRTDVFGNDCTTQGRLGYLCRRQ